MNGKELCNAYSELNDPIDQLDRFQEQLRLSEKGDDEAMFIDMDFVRALEYGMPTCSGMGMGIDRLTMFMTGQTTIQDVLFFPQMRPEKAAQKRRREGIRRSRRPGGMGPRPAQKMSLLTVEAMRKIAPGKLFNDLCGFNKKNKLGLKNPTIEDVRSWIGGITPHTGFRRLRPRQRTTPSQHTPSVEPSYKKRCIPDWNRMYAHNDKNAFNLLIIRL